MAFKFEQLKIWQVVTCLYLGKRRSLVTEDQFKTHYDGLDKLVAMIQKFKNILN